METSATISKNFQGSFFMKTLSIIRISNNTSLTDNACYGQLAFRRLWNRCWQREHTVEKANHMRNKPPTWSIAVGRKWAEAFWTSLCAEKGAACTWASKFVGMCCTKNDLKNKAVPVARWATTLMRKPKQSLTRRCQMNLTWRRNVSWVCRGKAKKRKWKLWFPASSCHEGDTTLCKQKSNQAILIAAWPNWPLWANPVSASCLIPLTGKAYSRYCTLILHPALYVNVHETARLVSLCFRRAPQFSKKNPALLPQRNLSPYTDTSRTFLSASSSLKCSETLPSLKISSPCWPLCILPALDWCLCGIANFVEVSCPADFLVCIYDSFHTFKENARMACYLEQLSTNLGNYGSVCMQSNNSFSAGHI